MKRAAILLTLLFLVSGASAHFSLEEGELDKMKNAYNSNTDEVPGIARSIVGDQIVVAHIETENGTKNVTAVFDGVKMVSLERGVSGDATVEVWTSKKALNQVGESASPRKALNEKLEGGGIRYEVRGFFNQVKFSILRALL